MEKISPNKAYYTIAAKGKASPELEDIIADDAGWSLLYAMNVLCGPFLAGEKAISSDAHSSYYYAYNVIKSPFPKGEDAIANDAGWACCYARDVLKAPFPKAENTISDNVIWAKIYIKQFGDVLNNKSIDKFKNAIGLLLSEL